MALTETNSIAVPGEAGRASGLVSEIKGFWKHFFATAFNPYRPELHYMRGPGPKWHAKHDPAPEVMHRAPVLARVRVKA